MINLKDPRDLQTILLVAFTLVGQFLLEFQVTPLQIVITVLVSVILDLVLSYAKKGEWINPKSAIITGLGTALMLRGDSITPFIMASIVGIGLKHILRYKNNHIFNPSNIGVVTIAILFPITVATAPLQWGFYIIILVLISLFGLYLTHKVKRLYIVLSFLGSFIFFGFIRMIVFDHSLHYIFNEFIWGGLFVFTFHMITDPKTSPSLKKEQIFYGVLTALLGQLMIEYQIPSALLVSLAFVCFLRFIVSVIKNHRKTQSASLS